MYSIDQFERLLAETLLKHNFQVPMTWVMIGVNGHIFAGRFNPPTTEKEPVGFVIIVGEAKRLRFPINLLLVDRDGMATHFFFENPDLQNRAMMSQVGHA